jgi:AAA+ ATPase superfamily predicted ATPase
MMKFYDREPELQRLHRFEKLAHQALFFIRVTGRRRIGKTLLIRQYLGQTQCQSLYFFVTKKKEKLLLDFWFRYIFKNKSRIEMLNQDRMAAEILEDLPVFTGKKFEKFITTHLMEMNRNNRIRFDRIGHYWDRGETEIDIIFTNDKDKEIYFGECKLSQKRFKISDIKEKINRFLHVQRKYADNSWKKFLNLYTLQVQSFLYQSIPLE